MRIGELSARTGVSARSLRYYEAQGLIDADRDASGYRDYDETAIERASTIHLLFGMGMPRDAVRSVLSCTGNAPASAHDDAVQRLEVLREDLGRRIATMTETHRALTAFLSARGASRQQDS